MKRARITAAVLCVSVALSGAVGVARAEEQTLKQMMGANFAGLQQILVALITSNYASVPTQVELIHEHATELTQRVPSNAEADRDRFLTYAYQLRAHADDINSIVHALMEHDQGEQQLATDSLREAAAAHFGGMVTMCVACHNRFRPRVVD